MELFESLTWYNILIIILLLIIAIAIIMLPTTEAASTKSCSMTCPDKHHIDLDEHFNNKQTQQQTQTQTVDDEPKNQIVFYYATWCHYCKAFFGDWSKFTDYAKSNLKNLRTMSVRCEDGNESVCQQKGVTGYPTVILYTTNGAEHKFEGPRTFDGLKNFVNGMCK